MFVPDINKNNLQNPHGGLYKGLQKNDIFWSQNWQCNQDFPCRSAEPSSSRKALYKSTHTNTKPKEHVIFNTLRMFARAEVMHSPFVYMNCNFLFIYILKIIICFPTAYFEIMYFLNLHIIFCSFPFSLFYNKNQIFSGTQKKVYWFLKVGGIFIILNFGFHIVQL